MRPFISSLWAESKFSSASPSLFSISSIFPSISTFNFPIRCPNVSRSSISSACSRSLSTFSISRLISSISSSTISSFSLSNSLIRYVIAKNCSGVIYHLLSKFSNSSIPSIISSKRFCFFSNSLFNPLRSCFIKIAPPENISYTGRPVSISC